jgi:DNA-binding response OmpR family regulator
LAAFEAGVDDIMTVPFSPEELLARVMALTRRAYGEALKLPPVIKVGDLEIDILNRQVRAGSSSLHLTGVEQSLLYLLAANAGQLLSRNDIMDAMGRGLYRREQCRRPAHPESASETARRLAKASIYRD